MSSVKKPLSRLLFFFASMVMLQTNTVSAQSISYYNMADCSSNDPENSFGTTCVGDTSIELKLVVSGVSLTTQELDINNDQANSAYNIANMGLSLTSGGPYTSSLALVPENSTWSGSNLANTTVYVVFIPTSAGTYTFTSSPGSGIPLTSTTAGTLIKVAQATGSTYAVTTPTATVTLPLPQYVIPGFYSCTMKFIGAASACAPLTAYGVEYSTSNGFANGTGIRVAGGLYTGCDKTFEEDITSGLSMNTTYYYHVYATNSGGTVYSAQSSFTTMNMSYSPASLDFGTECVFTTGHPQAYTLTLTNLPQLGGSGWNLFLTAPLGFQIAQNPSGPYGATLNLPGVGTGTTYTTTIYAEFSPGTVGVYNGSNSNIQTNVDQYTYGYSAPPLAMNGLGITSAIHFVTSSLNITKPVCTQTNGTVTGMAFTGGIAPYSVIWQNSGYATISQNDTLANVGTGVYSCMVTDSSQCSADTLITLTGISTGSAPVIAGSNDSLCQGDTANICPNPENYSRYTWSNGATSTCIHAITGGNYSLTVTDDSGCIAVSNSLLIFEYPIPVILNHGDTLSTDSAVNYQWYYNGRPVSGDTTAVFVATTPGSYFVQATNAAECTADSHTFMVTGLNQLSADIGFTIYPNPVSNDNMVRITTGADATGQTIQMFDTEGRLVLTSKINNPVTEISIGNLAPGLYLVKGAGVVKKLLKD